MALTSKTCRDCGATYKRTALCPAKSATAFIKYHTELISHARLMAEQDRRDSRLAGTAQCPDRR